jgi:hypothetical protein
VIIFDGIARTLDDHIFKARHGLQELQLHVGGERRRETVRVDGRVIEPFGFQENEMAILIGKPHDLVFDRRAIARAARLDATGIHR